MYASEPLGSLKAEWEPNEQAYVEPAHYEAVHLLASFASLEAKLSQLCSSVRQPCLIMGKAAPALRQVSQKLRN